MQTDQSPGLDTRLVDLIRWIAVRGIAAVAVGAVVLGVGGRLVMLASRLIHPEAVGRITENGNRIGEFTIGGTIALIVFGGVLSGMFAGLVWVAAKEWIPDNSLIVGLGSLAFGGLFLVDSGNIDFVILGDPRLDLVMLLGLLFLYGAVLVPTDRWLDRRLPQRAGVVSVVVYVLLISFGAPLLIPLLGFMFSEGFCQCSDPPILLGVGFVATAVATVTWWILRLRGAEQPPPWLRAAGGVSVALAFVAGVVYLTNEILAIV